jgi:hypothetical protein
MASPTAISQLFIATQNAIYLHSQLEKKLLFECATSDGILNARPSRDNSSLLAVADNHLVILHDFMRGKGNREYKLMSGDVGSLGFPALELTELTRVTGQASTSALLARLPRPLLHHNAQLRHPSVLCRDR